MGRAARILSLVVVGSVLCAGRAGAFSNDPSACTACHPQDGNVMVIVNQGSCTQDGNKMLSIGVGTQYPYLGRAAGRAVFDPVVNIRNGNLAAPYGTWATTIVPANHTYRVYGVSDYSSFQSGTLGGANSVYVYPTCPPACVDADADSYSISGGSCGALDCNDGNASIHPNATEIKHDGVDQDCNGYDLTIEVTKASYNTRTMKLTVQATSDFGAGANLTVDTYGAMTHSRKTGLWSLTVNTSPKPATVTVRGFEGAVTVPVQ